MEETLWGKSGAVLAQRLGRTIDEHRLVARVGVSPTKGFEGFVGSKTHARFVGMISIRMVVGRIDRRLGRRQMCINVVFDGCAVWHVALFR